MKTKAEYILLFFATFVFLLAISFFVLPIVFIVLGLFFALFGILTKIGPKAGDFMIWIAKLSWKYWYVSIALSFILAFLYSYITKKIFE